MIMTVCESSGVWCSCRSARDGRWNSCVKAVYYARSLRKPYKKRKCGTFSCDQRFLQIKIQQFDSLSKELTTIHIIATDWLNR